jgi:dGTPase
MMNWHDLLNSNRSRTSTGATEHRSQFERDFDRCTFSTPVKRLQDKAQVFPLEAHDAVRTRLTHSLEVSSVARGLGVAVGKWLAEQGELSPRDGETVYDVQRSIESICATCGLIHDLGNPPFGHAGEEAIKSWFDKRFGKEKPEDEQTVLQKRLTDPQQHADMLHFDGNAQTIRLVAKLQVLADQNGLNLTLGTLSALRKYVSASTEIRDGSASRKKAGHFASENLLIQRIKDETGVGESRNPLTFLIEAADDIVYSVADVEDAVKKKILSWRELEGRLREATSSRLDDILERKQAILSTGNVPHDRLPDDIQASAFRTAAIYQMVTDVLDVFRREYEAIMRGTFDQALIDASESATLQQKLTKVIGRKYVYSTAPTLKLELMGRRVITDLLDVFWEGAQIIEAGKPPKTTTFSGKAAALLSENYKRVFESAIESDPSSEAYHRFLLVTDYICGMTDTFSKHLHAELFNGG